MLLIFSNLSGFELQRKKKLAGKWTLVVDSFEERENGDWQPATRSVDFELQLRQDNNSGGY